MSFLSSAFLVVFNEKLTTQGQPNHPPNHIQIALQDKHCYVISYLPKETAGVVWILIANCSFFV